MRSFVGVVLCPRVLVGLIVRLGVVRARAARVFPFGLGRQLELPPVGRDLIMRGHILGKNGSVGVEFFEQLIKIASRSPERIVSVAGRNAVVVFRTRVVFFSADRNRLFARQFGLLNPEAARNLDANGIFGDVFVSVVVFFLFQIGQIFIAEINNVHRKFARRTIAKRHVCSAYLHRQTIAGFRIGRQFDLPRFAAKLRRGTVDALTATGKRQTQD